MTAITLFDPAMCCSTGICGPSVDPELTRVAAALHQLKKQGIEVQRYNLANDPAQFVQNPVVKEHLDQKGTEALPLLLVDDQPVLSSRYPSNDELASFVGVDASLLVQKKPKLTIELHQK